MHGVMLQNSKRQTDDFTLAWMKHAKLVLGDTVPWQWWNGGPK